MKWNFCTWERSLLNVLVKTSTPPYDFNIRETLNIIKWNYTFCSSIQIALPMRSLLAVSFHSFCVYVTNQVRTERKAFFNIRNEGLLKYQKLKFLVLFYFFICMCVCALVLSAYVKTCMNICMYIHGELSNMLVSCFITL